MTTRFEQIAKAFPLHAQRIAELTCANYAGSFASFMYQSDKPDSTACSILYGAFPWGGSAEGYDYWSALAEGART